MMITRHTRHPEAAVVVVGQVRKGGGLGPLAKLNTHTARDGNTRDLLPQLFVRHVAAGMIGKELRGQCVCGDHSAVSNGFLNYHLGEGQELLA